MKKLITIAIWTFIIVGFGLLLGFSSLKHKNIICKNYTISISYDDVDTFLRIKNVEQQILSSGDSIVGKSLKAINTGDIEKMIEENPFVKKADVFSTVEGDIEINVIQRKPIVRIINNSNEGFYIDSEGSLMPLNKRASTRVLIANGNIKDKYNSTVIVSEQSQTGDTKDQASHNLQNIYKLALYIDRDDFMKAMIDQVYINRKNEIEMIPKVGDHLIMFGDINDMNEKFDKLKALYKYGFRKSGWRQYKTINLKYKNQVVCSKN